MTLRCKLFNLIQCVSGIKMWISCYNLLLLLVLLLSTRWQNPHKIFWCHVQIHNWINSYAKRATNLSHNLFCSVLDSFFLALYMHSSIVYLNGVSSGCMHALLFSFVCLQIYHRKFDFHPSHQSVFLSTFLRLVSSNFHGSVRYREYFTFCYFRAYWNISGLLVCSPIPICWVRYWFGWHT